VAAAVRIAGAGLAGLSAGLALAAGGRSVEVYERKTRLLPSSGPHTEGIRNYRATDVLNELRSCGFDVPPFATVQRTIRFSPHHRNELRGPAHYLFTRGTGANTVDQILFRRAKEVGVRFYFGKDLDPSEADIVATGPPQRVHNVLGAGYTFSAEGSRIDPEIAYGLFDNDVAPAGYLVITPGIEFHSIYSVSWKELDFDRLLASTEGAFGLPWIREILGTSRWVGKIHGRAYYMQDPISNAVQGGALLVGEAGGFQDAVAGFGFRYAAMTGGLAARAILTGEDYRTLLRSIFEKEFEDAYAFRERLNHATNDDYDRMIERLGPKISLEDYAKRREARGF
jgi:flavin-dependent dehydrogenase